MRNTMREILFRGQTRRYGERIKNPAGDKMPSNWVYGGIFQGPNKSIIYSYEPVEKHVVYSDTVGLYTGLTDKNGTKIFEGDIVRHYNSIIDLQRFEIGAIYWDTEKCKFVRTTKCGFCEVGSSGIYEVIGNIYDNLDLLEKHNET